MNPPSRRVAILREPARAEQLRLMLAKRGYEVFVRPVTRIEYLEHPKEEDWAGMVRESRGVVFTSLNGVEALAHGVGGVTALGRLLPGRFVAVLGRQGYRKLKSIRARTLFVPAKCGSAGLARRLLLRLPPASKVLYPSAAEVCPGVKDILESAGHSVRRLVCYRTLRIGVDNRNPLEWAFLDLAIVAAPSAVDAVADDPSLPPNFPFVAIGPTTAAALREHGMAVLAVAESPGVESMFSLIQTVCPPRRCAEGWGERA